jgi:hypothetical protein
LIQPSFRRGRGAASQGSPLNLVERRASEAASKFREGSSRSRGAFSDRLHGAYDEQDARPWHRSHHSPNRASIPRNSRSHNSTRSRTRLRAAVHLAWSTSGPGEASSVTQPTVMVYGHLTVGGIAEPFMSSAQVATLDCTRPCPICHHPMDLSRIETVPWGRRTAGERLDFCCAKCGMIRTEWTAIPFLAAPETAPT